MFYVEMYFRVRRACLVEGMSVREASRVFDLHRDTVRKMLDNATPQGYTRQSPPRKPKLEPYLDFAQHLKKAGCHRSGAATSAGLEGFSLSAADPDIQELPVALHHPLADPLGHAA